MSPSVRKSLSYIIPPLVTVGLCYILYSDIDLRGILDWLPKCDFILVVAFLSCNVGAMLLRALRWRLQLRAIGVNPPYGVMARSIFGCYAVNLVFPRLGELWRSAYVAKEQSKPFSGIFGTMVADRLADTLTVLIIFLLAFILSSEAMSNFLAESNAGSSLGGLLTSWPVLALAATAIAAAIYIKFGRDALACKVRAFISRTWQGFAVLFKMPRRGLWLLLTLGIWSCYIISMGLSMLAFPPTAHLISAHGPACVMLTFVFGSMAMAIPSNGGIGPWQVAIIMSLSGLYGLDKETALTFATLNLAATTLLTIALGIATFVCIAFISSRKKNNDNGNLRS